MLQPKKNNQATRQDSLAIYNNSIAKTNFYKNNKNYKEIKSNLVNFKDSNTLKKLVKESIKTKNDYINSQGEIIFGIGTDEIKTSSKNITTRTGKVKGTSTVYSAPDIISNNVIDTYFHPNAPPIYFSSSILPQGSKTYGSKKYGDISTAPYYAPLAVKPFDLLTPKEKEQRVKEYGRDGVPTSYKPTIPTKNGVISGKKIALSTSDKEAAVLESTFKPNNIKPKKVVPLPSITKAGVNTTDNSLESNIEITNKREFIKPRGYKVVEESPATFGGRKVIYNVTNPNNINTDEGQTKNGNTRTIIPTYAKGGKLNNKTK